MPGMSQRRIYQCLTCEKPFPRHFDATRNPRFCSRVCRGIASTKGADTKRAILTVAGVKRCSTCGETKDITEFWKDRQKKDGIGIRCKSCRADDCHRYYLNSMDRRKAYAKKHHALNLEKSRKGMRIYALKSNYGLTTDEYSARFDQQDGLCKICKAPLPDDFKGHIDHCHISKRVRGILCRYCNTGLGMFKDDPKLLRDAIEYLKEDHETETKRQRELRIKA